jgi:diguanylate cyclase (GGDEF)-like protein
MSLLRKALWLFVIGAVVGIAALFLTGHMPMMDRLNDLFWTIQVELPFSFSLEQFLVALTTVSLFFTALIIVGCAAVLAVVANRHVLGSRQMAGRLAAAKREIDHIKEQYHRQYDQLVSVGKTLSKQLDKHVLIQGLLEAASRITSSTTANSIASLWLFYPETDAFRFERGLYCDETLFTKAAFQPTEEPFARLLASEQPFLLPPGEMDLGFTKPEKAARLGSATGLIAVPFVIEGRVLAVLALFCHPDILKGYEEQRPFYNAIWTELMFAATIAIQGAVTILDRLTGVHTREYVMGRLFQEIDRANRYHLPVSLLMIDIDNFKLVNDMLGHPQGDAVLKLIARLIKREVRAIDLVGRYGGEEFIVMLPDTGYGQGQASAAGALVVAERIRKAVDDEFRGLQKPLALTVSVGVAVRRFPEDREMDSQELVRLADVQLYQAKTTGKNRVCSVLQENPGAVV